MPIITPQDPYFLPKGVFKRKYGVFTDPATMGSMLSTMLEDRQPQAINQFEQAINSLIDEFKKSSTLEKAFYTMIEKFRADGLVQMTLRRAKHSEYHTAEHAAELSHDTHDVLTTTFKKNFSASKTNQLFLELAKAAASWHDIVQDRGAPPINEKESAHEFVIRFNELLEKFKLQYPTSTSAIIQFQQQLDFISRELIIYDTWLVFGMEPGLKLVAKPFSERFNDVMNDLNASRDPADKIVIGDGANFQRLLAASNAISIGDTKRFALEHVLQEQSVSKALQGFPPANQKTLANFFQAAHITTPRDKEQFLGLMCQNIRIFPELNKPEQDTMSPTPSSERLISKVAHDSFVDACDNIKLSPSYALNKAVSQRTHSMFDDFMNIKNIKGDTNIAREITFARAQQDPMWDKHAEHLLKFTQYVKSLDATQTKILAETMIVLATRHQPGCYLLKKDKTFHAQLQQVEKYQKALDVTKSSTKVAPELKDPTSPKRPVRNRRLSTEQNATELAFSSYGIKHIALPTQAQTNLAQALERFCSSLFSNVLARLNLSRRASYPPSDYKKPATLLKDIFKVESSKLESGYRHLSTEREVSVSKSYLEPRYRADSTSTFLADDEMATRQRSRAIDQGTIKEESKEDIQQDNESKSLKP